VNWLKNSVVYLDFFGYLVSAQTKVSPSFFLLSLSYILISKTHYLKMCQHALPKSDEFISSFRAATIVTSYLYHCSIAEFTHVAAMNPKTLGSWVRWAAPEPQDYSHLFSLKKCRSLSLFCGPKPSMWLSIGLIPV